MGRLADGPNGWIGVDFDRTLATRQHDGDHSYAGEPIPAMVERVKTWLAEGRRVKIFSARVSGYYTTGDDAAEDFIRADNQEAIIDSWCFKMFGTTLPVTCIKDAYCKEIWDDIAVAVEENTGRQLSPSKLCP